jgi:hypothetical protein
MLENTLENTIEQTDLTIPADAIELSTDDLEEVTGAQFGSCFGFGSCFTAFKFSVSFNECFEFFRFGSCDWGSCWN